MPYRRLPNTDAARIRAMKNALDQKLKKDDIFELPFSLGVLQKLEFFLPKFELAVTNSKRSKNIQVSNNKEYLEKYNKAKLYVSHFLQVVNLAIIRGEINKSAREFYGINIEDKTVPSISTESTFIEWSQRIINGEEERLRNGGNAIYTPSIALVKMHFQNFMDSYNYQKKLQDNSSRFSKEILSLRDQADEIILELWNEIEKSFEDIEDEEKRELATEYGVVYVYRKKERKNLMENTNYSNAG